MRGSDRRAVGLSVGDLFQQIKARRSLSKQVMNAPTTQSFQAIIPSILNTHFEWFWMSGRVFRHDPASMLPRSHWSQLFLGSFPWKKNKNKPQNKTKQNIQFSNAMSNRFTFLWFFYRSNSNEEEAHPSSHDLPNANGFLVNSPSTGHAAGNARNSETAQNQNSRGAKNTVPDLRSPTSTDRHPPGGSSPT